MNVYYNCDSLYLKYGLNSLIKENIGVLAEKIENLYIFDISNSGSEFSLMMLIDDNYKSLCKPGSRILVIKKRYSIHDLKIKGMQYLSSDASLQEWRIVLTSLIREPAVSIDSLLIVRKKIMQKKLTSQEVYLIRCLRMSMDLCSIADSQGISVKRCYSALYSIRRKLAFNSVREIYINIEEINNRFIKGKAISPLGNKNI